MIGLHACKTPVVIVKDVEQSLDDVQDNLEGMQAKTKGAVEATVPDSKSQQVS